MAEATTKRVCECGTKLRGPDPRCFRCRYNIGVHTRPQILAQVKSTCSCGSGIYTERDECNRCYQRRIDAERRKSTQGRCRACSRVTLGRRDICHKCIKNTDESRVKQKTRAENRRKKRKKLGLCATCGVVATVGRYCLPHWFCMIASNRVKNHSLGPELHVLFQRQGGRCAYTNQVLTPGSNASIDHKLPLSRGGGNELNNLHWVDMAINSMKNDLTHEEFVALCRTVADTTKNVIVAGLRDTLMSSRRSFSSRGWGGKRSSVES